MGMQKSLSAAFQILVALWLGVFVLLEFKVLSGFVLCVGQDGHVQLEAALNENCCGPDFPANQPLLVSTTRTSHCGECLDLPLSSQVPMASLSRHSNPGSDFQTLKMFDILPRENAPAVSIVQRRPVRPSAQIASLQTTHLLI